MIDHVRFAESCLKDLAARDGLRGFVQPPLTRRLRRGRRLRLWRELVEVINKEVHIENLWPENPSRAFLCNELAFILAMTTRVLGRCLSSRTAWHPICSRHSHSFAVFTAFCCWGNRWGSFFVPRYAEVEQPLSESLSNRKGLDSQRGPT